MVQGQSVDSYVFMLHMFEHFEFPVSPLGVDGRLEGSCQLFDGHFFRSPILLWRRLTVFSTANLSIGPATDLK